MTITAKYASTCRACHKPVTPGQSIEWTRGSRDVRHTSCGGVTTDAATVKRAFRPTTCIVCGHREQRDARGYPIGDRILRSGECQSCYDERRMGY